MRFRLIGPFQVTTDDGDVLKATPPKISQIMALLLIRANEHVEQDALIRELWNERPPRSALNTLQTYVHHARRLLAPGLRTPDVPTLVTRPGGYVMLVDDDEVDTHVFQRLVTDAAADLRSRRCESALEALTSALALWRGPVMSNIPTGAILAGHVVRLQELRIRALEMRVETMNGLGLSRETIPELRSLVHDYPLNEWFHGQLISALHRAGRRSEALHAYQRLRRTLHDELGMEPSAEARRAQQSVLGPSAAETAC